ncbi:MAG: glycoside hydrolase family 16 protein [Xanthomonadales bacterium]|nr:glycoside hydrolase family 16 protein [Xanthomonadales bacterium]
MKQTSRLAVFLLLPLLFACSGTGAEKPVAARWQVNFFDDFDTFNTDHWQDQILWVNNEDQCYVRNGAFGTREVSDGTLKLRVVNLGEPRPCDNLNKAGERHPDTPYVAGRITSKNLKEFARGRWTARLRIHDPGQDGMFPAWWLLGYRNNEPPVQEEDENVCWPLPGSGEIDIFEHHSHGGPRNYASRIIEHQGNCDGGDWESSQAVLEADLDEYHEYSVAWLGEDLVFARDGMEVLRLAGHADDFAEPMFAILNFAKFNDAPMTGEWVMEVDWVQHESLR